MAPEDLSPTHIRRKRFEMVRRGFDPQEVGAFLERVADRLASAERAVEEAEARLSSASHELEDAKAAEEALQLTMVAATQAKDEMLARATTQAEEVRAAATREAETLVSEARRQALNLIEESRREASDVVAAARREHGELLVQVDELRGVVDRVRQMLGSMAGSVGPGLEEAERILADPGAIVAGGHAESVPEMAVVEAAPDDAEGEEQREIVAPLVAAMPGVEEAEDVEATPPARLEVVVSDETGGGEDVDHDDADEEDDGPAGDEAAEVERLLRQLRGG